MKYQLTYWWNFTVGTAQKVGIQGQDLWFMTRSNGIRRETQDGEIATERSPYHFVLCWFFVIWKTQQIIIQNTLSVSKHAQWIFSTQLRLINSHQIWTWRVRTSEKREGFLSRSSVKGSVLRTWQKIDNIWGQCPDNVDIIYHFPNLLHSESASMKDRERWQNAS